MMDDIEQAFRALFGRHGIPARMKPGATSMPKECGVAANVVNPGTPDYSPAPADWYPAADDWRRLAIELAVKHGEPGFEFDGPELTDEAFDNEGLIKNREHRTQHQRAHEFGRMLRHVASGMGDVPASETAARELGKLKRSGFYEGKVSKPESIRSQYSKFRKSYQNGIVRDPLPGDLRYSEVPWPLPYVLQCWRFWSNTFHRLHLVAESMTRDIKPAEECEPDRWTIGARGELLKAPQLPAIAAGQD